jgi:translation initiation factor eIF-2B subunit epsilon
MRDLDARNLITGDFVIVSGDVVSNFPLESALAKHRARREKDKNAIMTMILREAGSSHRSKPKSVAPVFVINPEKDRVLHYEEMRPKQESRYINLDPDLLSEQEEIDVRSDLIDCYIDICTPDVLALWTDSFDYESPRKHFLFGVLKDYELNGKTIHTHIVKDHYAARVQNLQTYDAISKDVISRWAYPLCPESNLLQGQKYELQRGNIYEEDGVVLARSCKIKRRTVIGRDTSVGDGSVISNSVLGRRCQIGKNVSIDGAYVWDDVIIGDDSVVTRAIIANESAIGRRCTIEPGSLVSFKVRISDDTILSKHSRVTTAKRKGEDNDEEKSVRSDVALVGNQGEGYRFEESEDEDDEDESDQVERMSSGLSKC